MVASFLGVVKTALTRRLNQGHDAIVPELQALREEVRQLRQQNNDVILSLDSNLHHVGRRLEHLETRVQLDGGPEALAERATTAVRAVR